MMLTIDIVCIIAYIFYSIYNLLIDWFEDGGRKVTVSGVNLLAQASLISLKGISGW